MLGFSDSTKKRRLGIFYDTERPERLNDHSHVGHCVHARVVVYMYLIFVMTGQNISATKDCKFASVRRSLNLAFVIE